MLPAVEKQKTKTTLSHSRSKLKAYGQSRHKQVGEGVYFVYTGRETLHSGRLTETGSVHER